MSCKTVKKPTSIYNLFMSAQIITLEISCHATSNINPNCHYTRDARDPHWENISIILDISGSYKFVQVIKKLQYRWFLSSTEIFPWHAHFLKLKHYISAASPELLKYFLHLSISSIRNIRILMVPLWHWHISLIFPFLQLRTLEFRCSSPALKYFHCLLISSRKKVRTPSPTGNIT